MTGSCVLNAGARIQGDFVILPSSAHKSDEPVMLDGMKLEELESRLGLPVRALDFEGFARTLLEG